jgi:hypothetical protein
MYSNQHSKYAFVQHCNIWPGGMSTSVHMHTQCTAPWI